MAKQSTVGKLAELAVRQAKGRERAYKLSDGGSLYILVKPNGAKYWRLKYHLYGKEKVLALGVYPGVSMAEARREAVKAKENLRQGIDPVHERKQDKQSSIENSFRNLAKEWFKIQSGSWTSGHADRVWITLEKDVFPHIGDQPIQMVTTPDCLAIIRAVEARGALDVASRVKQRMSSIFRYAIQTARCEYNPADQLTGVIQTRKVTHMKYVPAEALPSFLNKLENYQGSVITKLALKLIVHTFVRPGDIRGATWDEFNLDEKVWRISGDREKMRDEHIVPLSSQSIKILEELYQITGHLKLLFPGVRDNRVPMSENTLTFAIKKRLGFDATAHGFKTTASTILNEEGFRNDAIERQLSHRERDKTRAVYNRSQYLPERREMMQWWGDYLEARMM